MKFLKSLKNHKSLLIVAAITITLASTGAGIVVNVSATNAAAAEHAREEADGKQRAEAAAATRLRSAKADAERAMDDGEAIYASSSIWGDADERTHLRSSLDTLAKFRSEGSVHAEDLESATTEVIAAIQAVGNPPAPISLICGNIHANVDYTRHDVILNPDGTAQYNDLWAMRLGCDTGMSGVSVDEQVNVQTPLQRAAVAAAKDAGYGELLGSDAKILYAVYEGCGSSGPASYYSGIKQVSATQAKEINALLTLCPNHPDAAQWRAAAGAGQKAQEARANGTRVDPGGTYNIPSQMARGTFVAENVADCYWETRDANGNIVANNFVLAAPSVTAEVTPNAVVFTTSGSCGEWSRQ